LRKTERRIFLRARLERVNNVDPACKIRILAQAIFASRRALQAGWVPKNTRPPGKSVCTDTMLPIEQGQCYLLFQQYLISTGFRRVLQFCRKTCIYCAYSISRCAFLNAPAGSFPKTSTSWI
jgi:hypothetical protein